MPNQYVVESEALRAVLEYLGTRPFSEVRHLVEALERSRVANVVGETKDE
jgi:hypothetical protein